VAEDNNSAAIMNDKKMLETVKNLGGKKSLSSPYLKATLTYAEVVSNSMPMLRPSEEFTKPVKAPAMNEIIVSSPIKKEVISVPELTTIKANTNKKPYLDALLLDSLILKSTSLNKVVNDVDNDAKVLNTVDSPSTIKSSNNDIIELEYYKNDKVNNASNQESDILLSIKKETFPSGQIVYFIFYYFINYFLL
jgi:hypothetical protein